MTAPAAAASLLPLANSLPTSPPARAPTTVDAKAVFLFLLRERGFLDRRDSVTELGERGGEELRYSSRSRS